MNEKYDKMSATNSKGESSMTTKAQKWGNSIGVRIPFKVAEKYGLVNGSEVEIKEQENGFLIEPVEKDLSLEEMLEQITNENRHDYIDFGRKGDELI